MPFIDRATKSRPSEFGHIANDLAIQIHGGYGYTRDLDVEQVYRDNRLNPIHEGTHGIQAIDLLGRKILRESRVRACRFFFSNDLPKARLQLTLVNPLTSEAADFPETCF